MSNMADKKDLTNVWSLDEIELLITLVKQHPELYDQSKPGYLNMVISESCWQTIADTVQTKDVQACKTKWQILRGCYRSRRSGGKGSKKWQYYESLNFLDNYIGQRKSYVKLSSPENVDDDYFETVILDPNLDYEECSQITIEENHSMPESNSSVINSSNKGIKRSVSPVQIEEALTRYFRSKRPKSSIHLFLQSMEEDIAKLSPKGLRNFKRDILETLEKYLEAEGKDTV